MKLTEKNLRRLYTVKRLPLNYIALELETNVVKINKMLKYYDIPKRPRIQTKKLKTSKEEIKAFEFFDLEKSDIYISNDKRRKKIMCAYKILSSDLSKRRKKEMIYEMKTNENFKNTLWTKYTKINMNWSARDKREYKQMRKDLCCNTPMYGLDKI